MTLPEILAKLERRLIVRALRNTEDNVQKAGDALGVHRTTLVEKMKRLGLGKVRISNERKWVSNRNIKAVIWLMDHQHLFDQSAHEIGELMLKDGVYAQTTVTTDINHHVREFISCIRDYYEWKKGK